MAKPNKPHDPNQPDITDELRRRDPPIPDAPATVPSAGIHITDNRPTEDGGVEQHPVHDSDTEDLKPEDYEELTDEVEEVGIKGD